jgi:hypothetical protein
MRAVRHRAACRIAFGLLPGTLAACSLVFPGDQAQCTVDSDCTSRGGALEASICSNAICIPTTSSNGADPDASAEAGLEASAAGDDGIEDGGGGPWSCVGHVKWPASSTALLTVTQPYDNLITSGPLPSVSVVPCERLDPTCANPLAQARTTDDGGVVSFPLFYGYNGYFLSQWDGALPMLLYINPPAYTNTPQIVGAFVTTDTMQTILSYVTASFDGGPRTVDMSRGALFIQTYDCTGQPAAGVSITMTHLDSQVVQVYFTNGLPDPTAVQTDVTGYYAAINVPIGVPTITMTLGSTQERLATSNVYIRAAMISEINVFPSPL